MKEMLPDGRAGLPGGNGFGGGQKRAAGHMAGKAAGNGSSKSAGASTAAFRNAGKPAGAEEQKLRNRQRKRRSATFIRKNKKNGSAGLPQL